MTPDILFQFTGPPALLGWLVLALSPLFPVWADRMSAIVIPALLSVAYTALVLAYWSDAPGGFDSLANVMLLFTDPHVALAGWVHYLAFDLLIGAWITRTARAEGVAHLLVLPCLGLTFLFGPAGFLLFTALRAIRAARTTATGAAA